jgi:hypothetical protein
LLSSILESAVAMHFIAHTLVMLFAVRSLLAWPLSHHIFGRNQRAVSFASSLTCLLHGSPVSIASFGLLMVMLLEAIRSTDDDDDDVKENGAEEDSEEAPEQQSFLTSSSLLLHSLINLLTATRSELKGSFGDHHSTLSTLFPSSLDLSATTSSSVDVSDLCEKVLWYSIGYMIYDFICLVYNNYCDPYLEYDPSHLQFILHHIGCVVVEIQPIITGSGHATTLILILFGEITNANQAIESMYSSLNRSGYFVQRNVNIEKAMKHHITFFALFFFVIRFVFGPVFLALFVYAFFFNGEHNLNIGVAWVFVIV